MQFLLRQLTSLGWKKPTLTFQTAGVIALLVNIVCASSYNGLAKSLINVLSPITLVCLSEAVTGFFVLLSFGTVPTIRKFSRLGKKELFPMLTIGLLSGVIGPLLLFFGLRQTTAINATLFGNAEMVFLTLFAVIFFRESFTKQHAFAIFTIIAGLLVITLKGFSQSVSLHPGDMLIVLSCVVYATGSAVFRRYLHRCEPHLVILARSSVAVTSFFLLSPFVSHPLIAEIRAFPITLIPAFLGFGFIARFLNLFSFYEAMEHLSVTTISMMMNISIVGSIIFAASFLGEKIEVYHFTGGGLILAGAVLLELAGLYANTQHLENQLHHDQ